MLLTGKEDLRVRKTMTAIKSAFEGLICEKNYEQITVKELCDRAMINKKTFYHYYPTLDDLLAELQMELSAGYLERVKDYRLPEDLALVNREFFRFSAEQGTAYEKITCSVAYAKPRQEMVDHVTATAWGKSAGFLALDPFRQELVLDFINTAVLGAYRRWVADGKRVPLEEIIRQTNRLVCGGVERYFQ